MTIKGLEKWGDSVVEDKLSNGNTLYYVERNGMFFSVGIFLGNEGKLKVYDNVNERLMDVLSNARKYGYRVRIWYGDRQTGRSWNEEYDVTGRVGRTSGEIGIPILVHNKRSWGGGAILVGSIIRIDDIEDHKTIWKVDNFHVEEMNVCPNDSLELPWKVEKLNEETKQWQTEACFKTEIQARKWVEFMEGKRYSKA